MTKPTGRQAFPSKPDGSDAFECGMTLRDYFAGQALITLSAGQENCTFSFIAERCYLYADAMIAERNKNG